MNSILKYFFALCIAFNIFTFASAATVSITNEHIITLTGEEEGDKAGATVENVGDINGDGIEDVAIGVSDRDYNPLDSVDRTGAVYLFYGAEDGIEPDDLGDADAVIVGHSETDSDLYEGQFFGLTVAAGDVNNDSYQDLVIGASGYDSADAFEIGAVYVVFGVADGWEGVLTLDEVDVVQLTGESESDNIGDELLVAHLNDDSYADIITGAIGDDDAASNAGAVYIIDGGDTTEWSFATDSIGDVDTTKITGAAVNDQLAGELAAGDVNGDGQSDLVMGTERAGADDAGAVYIIYGEAEFPSSGSVSARADVTWTGADGDFIGESLVLEDWNNDGLDDVAVGSPVIDSSAEDAGMISIVYGNDALESDTLSSVADAQWEGVMELEQVGIRLGTSTDMNGDGVADLMIGAGVGDPGSVYSVYLLYGSTTEWNGTTSLSDADGIITGESPHVLDETALASVDLNADGVGDIIIGTENYPYDESEEDYTDTGAVYLAYWNSDNDEDGVADENSLSGDGSDACYTNAEDAGFSEAVQHYADLDGDGYGNSSDRLIVCPSEASTNYIPASESIAEDCDDMDFDINAGCTVNIDRISIHGERLRMVLENADVVNVFPFQAGKLRARISKNQQFAAVTNGKIMKVYNSLGEEVAKQKYWKKKRFTHYRFQLRNYYQDRNDELILAGVRGKRAQVVTLRLKESSGALKFLRKQPIVLPEPVLKLKAMRLKSKEQPFKVVFWKELIYKYKITKKKAKLLPQ